MENNKITRPTVLEINLDNFEHNLEQIRNMLKPTTKIMPVIKANAYGTHINTKLDILNKFDIVAVAIVDEGEVLRKLGYKKDIFILNQPDINEIEKISQNNLIIGLSSIEFLKIAQKSNKHLKTHIEIETGMGRTGVTLDKIDEFLREIQKADNISVEGIYTHLSSADNDREYTEQQLAIFNKAVEKITSEIDNIKYIHASASNGIINFPDGEYNLVRAGMILYGYESGEKIKEKIDLKPVAKLKSKINYLKEVEEGTSISYGRKFVTKRASKIATIPIGYADGLRRSLSNKGEVLIDGKKVPIIGSICMDSFMADVTDLPDVKVGDIVYIWDNDKITLDDIAKECDTINYEILCTISERVPREFIRK